MMTKFWCQTSWNMIWVRRLFLFSASMHNIRRSMYIWLQRKGDEWAFFTRTRSLFYLKQLAYYKRKLSWRNFKDTYFNMKRSNNRNRLQIFQYLYQTSTLSICTHIINHDIFTFFFKPFIAVILFCDFVLPIIKNLHEEFKLMNLGFDTQSVISSKLKSSTTEMTKLLL